MALLLFALAQQPLLARVATVVFARATIVSPTRPEVLRRPDLVISKGHVRIKSGPTLLRMIPRDQPCLACYTVANQGNASSGPFRVEGGGLGVPAPPYQDHTALARGASHERCLEYSTTPPSRQLHARLTVDSRNAVTESCEDNNIHRVTVTVGP